jgi:hypothetical protein
MAEQTEVGWPICEQAGCTGIRLASAWICLARASEEETAAALKLAVDSRCILSGMRDGGRPARALTVANEYEIAGDSRENLIWTKEQLLVPLQPGMEAPPHPMRLGGEAKDCYRLGAAGLTGPATGGPER